VRLCTVDNDGTAAVQMSYADRLRLSALTKQVTHGKYSADVATDVGLLDVFGNDQRSSYLLTYLLCGIEKEHCHLISRTVKPGTHWRQS